MLNFTYLKNRSLSEISGLTPSDGNIIVGDGTKWVAESGATARASLGLGSIATQAANAVAITGGTASGLTSLSVTGAMTIEANSVVFQPATDSTTFLTISDADGGTAILTVNSTNEKIGICTAPNAALGACLQVEGNLAVGNIAAGGVFQQIYITGATGSVPAGVLYTAENVGAATNENLSFGASFNRGTAGAKVGIYYYSSAAPVGWTSGVEIANAAGLSNLHLMKDGGTVTVGGTTSAELACGADGASQGKITLWDGAGGNTPGYIKFHTPNGTAVYLFIEDDQTVKVHNAVPTANTDGSAVGDQTD
jgi:hypothetical protein